MQHTFGNMHQYNSTAMCICEITALYLVVHLKIMDPDNVLIIISVRDCCSSNISWKGGTSSAIRDSVYFSFT